MNVPSDAAIHAGPDDLVDLDLKARAKSVLQHPRRQLGGVEPSRDLVRGCDGREQNCYGRNRVRPDDVARELVVRAVGDHELYLVLRPDELEVPQCELRVHPGAGTLDVHDEPHMPSVPLALECRVEGLNWDLAVRLDGMYEVWRQSFDRLRHRPPLEEWLPPPPPPPRGGRAPAAAIAAASATLGLGLSRRVGKRVLQPRLAEPLNPEPARVACPARLRPAKVARPRELERHAETGARVHNVRLRHPDEGRVDVDRPTFDATLRAETGDLAKRFVELRAAVRIARVIDRVGRDVDLVRVDRLRVRQGEAEQDRVPSRDVRRGDAMPDLLHRPLLGDRRLPVGEGGTANLRQVDVEDLVNLDAEVFRNPFGGFDLFAVPLPVVDRERAYLASLREGDGKACARVEATGEEDHGARHVPGLQHGDGLKGERHARISSNTQSSH